MLMTVAELKELIETDESDFKLLMRLKAAEQAIRAYTHNNFVARATLRPAQIQAGAIACSGTFSIGDTVQIFQCEAEGLHTISEALLPGLYRAEENLPDGKGWIALVKYPDDVKLGAANMIRYDIEAEGREGISSESISRHSVSYAVGNESNSSSLGYPYRLTKFLAPYRRMQP